MVNLITLNFSINLSQIQLINYRNKKQAYKLALFLFILFSAIPLSADAEGNLSGIWRDSISISLLGQTQSLRITDTLYQDGDSIFMPGASLCPGNITQVELVRTSADTFSIPTPFQCSSSGVSIFIDTFSITFNGDHWFSAFGSGTATTASINAAYTLTIEGEKLSSTLLANNTTVENLSNDGEEIQLFRIDIPVNSENLNIFTIGGEGNLDLALIYGKPPFSIFTSFNGGSEENINVVNPSPGPWYLSLPNFSVFTGVTLNVELSGQPPLNISPNIRVNNSEGPVTVNQSETVVATIELDSGEALSQTADWWVAAVTPFDWFHYDAVTEDWKEGLLVSHQGPLFNLNTIQVLNVSNLPKGNYTIYFALDLSPNGTVDQPLVFDSVDLIVK